MYFLKKLSFPWGPVSKTRTEQLQKSQRVKAVNTLVNQKAFSPSRGFTMPVPISMMEGAKWPRLQEQSSTITWGHHWKGLFHTDKNMERWGKEEQQEEDASALWLLALECQGVTPLHCITFCFRTWPYHCLPQTLLPPIQWEKKNWGHLSSDLSRHPNPSLDRSGLAGSARFKSDPFFSLQGWLPLPLPLTMLESCRWKLLECICATPTGKLARLSRWNTKFC